MALHNGHRSIWKLIRIIIAKARNNTPWMGPMTVTPDSVPPPRLTKVATNNAKYETASMAEIQRRFRSEFKEWRLSSHLESDA